MSNSKRDNMRARKKIGKVAQNKRKVRVEKRKKLKESKTKELMKDKEGE